MLVLYQNLLEIYQNLVSLYRIYIPAQIAAFVVNTCMIQLTISSYNCSDLATSLQDIQQDIEVCM